MTHPPPPPTTPRPFARWLASRIVLGGGLLVSAGVLAALAWLGLHQRDEFIAADRARNELMARLLEEHATRTVDTVVLALEALGRLVAQADAPLDAAQLSPALTQSLASLPVLRSVALLDSGGRVLASSSADDQGLVVDLRRLPAAATGIAVGPLVSGRTLADSALLRDAPAGRFSRRKFIPMVLAAEARDGRPMRLLALLNPEAFSNLQLLALDNHDRSSLAFLASYRGVLLSSLRDLPPGTRLNEHPVFQGLLTQREHGSYVGRGLQPGPQLVAFRASRTRPLVVVVEHARADVMAAWWQAMRWFLLAGAGAVGLLLAMTLLATRSLRAREAAQQQLGVAQARVASSERELSVLIKSVQELLFRTDAQGALTFANARWLAISGGTPASAVGRRLADVVQPGSRAEVEALFQPSAAGGVRTAQATIVAPGGELRLLDVAVVPLRAGDQLVGFAGSATDVTGRWQAEQELQAQLSFSSLLLEISPLPVSMIDREGRLATVNQAWEEFRGIPREQVIGRAVSSLLAPADAAVHDAHDAALRQRGGRIRYDARLRHADGSMRDIVVTKVAVPDADGSHSAILTMFIDVSEFREAERATREARDAAEESSRTKTEFIGNISHELRTPLQAIIGFSELGIARGREQPRLAEMFGDVHAAGQRMLALVNDLLDLSKIDSAIGSFHLERVDLRQLVQAVARELDPLLSGKALTLELNLPQAPLATRADPKRMEQVIRNVLANAIKFSPARQSIEMAGRLDAQHRVVLSVRDHGPGVPAAELDLIFDAFVQSSRTKDGAGGTGLGLAICRKIVEAHGGEIHAHNAEGGGAEFHIVLPAHAGPGAQPPAP